MVNDSWILSIFGIYYSCRIVDVFTKIIGMWIVNDKWIDCVFGIVCLGCNMGIA